MSTGDWIAIIALCLVYGGAIIGFYVNIKVKISECEMKYKALDKKLSEHIAWGESEQRDNNIRFDKVTEEMKESYKELVSKMDLILEKFSNFQIYCEKNFKK